MKRTILSLMLALVAGSLFGQTVEELFVKYITMAAPNAQYEDTTDEVREAMKENKKGNDLGLTAKEIDFTLKSLKKCEQVQLTLDEGQLQELERDIQSLKGYEMLFIQNDNKEPNDSTSILGQLWNQTFAPKYKLAAYGKVKGNIVSNILLRWDIWGKVVLAHLDCKVRKDLLAQALFDGNLVSFGDDEDEGNLVDMKKVVEDVDNGHVLFVIHGKEHPEFHSAEEVRDYMIANGIRWNSETWVVGEQVKEKYPHTDRNVVIEYTETKKGAE
ncbi:MAG: hypothetical protein IJ635_01385 [Bacteroidaceae bacterium]|nr:hypothetical protein [Bacteroidaceae bacterium]MBR1519876.1 hypothetical protein [Bacteroidaceae bacterium]